MGVVIAGAGSVGLLIGSFLAEANVDVTMFVRRKEQADLISKKGIRRMNEDGTERVFHVDATTDMAKLPMNCLWIIAVKYSELHDLISQMLEGKVKEPVMFVQNGIGHLELAKKTDWTDIAFATVEHGALRTDDNAVRHNGIGLLTIGAGRGDARSFDVIEAARSDQFPVTRRADAEHVLMRKVIINCMINPLTAILEVENGELLTNRYCYELFNALYEELMIAFPEMRSVLPFETVSTVCRNTAKNRSSMLADRLAGRPMEIETIVTAVIEKAKAVHKKMPLLTTFEKMLYAVDEKGAGE